MVSSKKIFLSLAPLVFLGACSSKSPNEAATSAERVQEQQSIYTTPVTPTEESAPADEAKTPVKKSSKKKKSRSKTKR